MQRIPNIDLNDEQIRELTVDYYITSGSEGTICEGILNNTLSKINMHNGKILPLGDNKERKINELYKKQLEHSSIPVRTISHKGNIVGFEMTTDPTFDKYSIYNLSLSDQKQLLLRAKEVLEYFTANDVIYGDVELRNILYNKENGEVFFCDMDNTQVGEYPMDLLPGIINHYDSTRGIDDGVNAFAHNYLTLRMLGLDPYESRRAIRQQFKRQGYKIIHSMQEPKSFIKDYCITYMKK